MKIIQLFKNTYLQNRLFILIIINILIFIVGNFSEIFFIAGKIALIILISLIIIDFFLLFNNSKTILSASRKTPKRFSNGDDNKIFISIKSNFLIPISLKIIDEIPFQFQVRDFEINEYFKSKTEKTIQYILRPVKRGEYDYGILNVYATTILGLVSRRFRFEKNISVPVYPSYLQMRKYELLAISHKLTEVGIKKIRKISNNREFEEIRDYIKGDEFRTINWKATARMNKLMVNQYQDEKSQQVYSIIDMGRTMKKPFEKMSLLDYAINSSLVISNIAILKKDKAGLITFSKDIHSVLKATRKNMQMSQILQVLYKQKTDFLEANYELLYSTIRQKITKRSLLLIYTNFEGITSLQRQIEFFKKLSKSHLVVVIFFENTEIKEVLNKKPISTEEIYIKTIAEKFIYEKRQIVKELKKFGIHSILTEPKNLTVNTINKYLELKAVGLI